MTCVEKVTRKRGGRRGTGNREWDSYSGLELSEYKSACDLIDGWGAGSPASWRAALNWVSNHIRRGLGLARRVMRLQLDESSTIMSSRFTTAFVPPLVSAPVMMRPIPEPRQRY